MENKTSLADKLLLAIGSLAAAMADGTSLADRQTAYSAAVNTMAAARIAGSDDPMANDNYAACLSAVGDLAARMGVENRPATIADVMAAYRRICDMEGDLTAAAEDALMDVDGAGFDLAEELRLVKEKVKQIRPIVEKHPALIPAFNSLVQSWRMVNRGAAAMEV